MCVCLYVLIEVGKKRLMHVYEIRTPDIGLPTTNFLINHRQMCIRDRCASGRVSDIAERSEGNVYGETRPFLKGQSTEGLCCARAVDKSSFFVFLFYCLILLKLEFGW